MRGSAGSADRFFRFQRGLPGVGCAARSAFPPARMIALLQDRLDRIVAEFAPVALASSLSAEDMVLTDAIAAAELPVEIFVLDTGRLHGDTLSVVSRIESRYGIRVSIFRPQPAAVQAYVEENGPDGLPRRRASKAMLRHSES